MQRRVAPHSQPAQAHPASRTAVRGRRRRTSPAATVLAALAAVGVLAALEAPRAAVAAPLFAAFQPGAEPVAGASQGAASAAGQSPDPSPDRPAAVRDSAAPGPVCDSNTALTVIGMDTSSGLMLFALAGGSTAGGGGWVVGLDGAGREAHAYPERSGNRYGGSVGPGAIVAVESCGPECLQPVRWHGDAWQPLGDSLTVPSGSTLAATYDESGAPWLVAHAAGTRDGEYKAWSFRYEGHEWKGHGSLTVAAVGQPQAVPAPQASDGVTSGTGLFTASAPPSTWVQGLPGVTPDRRGQLLALGDAGAAYLSADGVAYLSADAGKTWRRSTWTPWGGGDTTGIWRQGKDYGIDLPYGDHRGALQLVWYDRRSAAAEHVLLTRLGPGGAWTALGQAPADVTTRSGEHLPVTQVLVPRPDTWILLSGCAATATGSGLVLRSFDHGQLSDVRFVPIAPTARPPLH
jgi:hypothetical protein